jgi:TonB family protein
MPILDLPPNPSPTPSSSQDPTDDAASRLTSDTDESLQPNKMRVGRFGELEEHELIHLLDTLDDERARARFRESVYISVIIYLAIAWFLFYGPRVLFHQPQFQDPIALMKQHDRELTFLDQHPAPVLRPVPRPVIDRKTMEKLQQERIAPPTPQPSAPQPQSPAPQPEQTHNVVPAAPLPPEPKAQADSQLPAAPHSNFAQNQSPRSALQDAMRGAMRGGGSGVTYGSSGSNRPVQAGAEILSDTMGVDFSAYMRQLKHDIQRNWDPLIPEEVQPPLMKKGIVGIRFSIKPDGEIEGITLETRSGDVALDRAAWNAITSEGDFPPLPKAFHGPRLELRCGFFYNTPQSE